jgi:catechol 2,3-dioxygenase-like lactoylglutathione lyase family enzyme
MKIHLTSIFVDDQEKALRFYTQVLGFVEKQNFPVGDFKWLTVASPEEPTGTRLLLEPHNNPAARAFQEALLAQGIPSATFFVDDIQHEYARLQQLGVAFTMPPTAMGPTISAIFDDTCGNLIQITQIS